MDGRTDEWTDGRTNERVNGRTNERVNGANAKSNGVDRSAVRYLEGLRLEDEEWKRGMGEEDEGEKEERKIDELNGGEGR